MKKIILILLLTIVSILGTAEYSFFRPYNSSGNYYLIDNPNRTNADGSQIHLAFEISEESLFSGEVFVLICNGTNATFIFQTALDGAEESKLEDMVGDHTNNI